MPYSYIDLRKVKTYSIYKRHNLVKFTDLIKPEDPVQHFENDELDQIVEYILRARNSSLQVIWMMGAHVIKCGLGPLIIDLMRKGIITHIAGNGAVAIHDLELALIGETSEDVATSIEDGTFGMAQETGFHTHKALRLGAQRGMGYGESLGSYIAQEKFPYREYSVLYNAFKLGIPMTLHVTIGADIVHQHPDCNFGILGSATGQDFKVFCASVSKLENGVFLNFGSAVTGAEVFLKAISITRNLGYPVKGFTTANFDLFPLAGNYHSSVGKDNPEYYYRPRKNIINRPISMGGQGFHIQANHLQTVPYLYHSICEKLDEYPGIKKLESDKKKEKEQDYVNLVKNRSTQAAEALNDLLERRPHLKVDSASICKAYIAIAESFERGGTLFLSGNGGSMSDALHISGELLKSFARARPLSPIEKARFYKESDGEYLAENIEKGFRSIVLGINPSLSSAVDNDFEGRRLGLAQELNALAKPGDILLGISTSGNAINIYYAALTAKAQGLTTILLTGESESRYSGVFDISIHAPAKRVDLVQEEHIAIYHCLCDMLERDFFS